MTNSNEITRRNVLIATGTALAGYGFLGSGNDDDDAIGGWVGGEDAVRLQTLTPTPGGTAITTEDSDGVGTAAGGIHLDGDERIVTNRHVVDDDYPDSDEDDVLGTEVYHVDGDEPIGEVVEVGDAKGAGASDWAIIEPYDDVWTPRVLGLPDLGESTTVSEGDRVVMSGMRTGLIAAQVTATGVSLNWRGTQLDNTIQYRVDEDKDTNGNSGSWIGVIEDGTFRPAGIHTFRDPDNPDYKHAIPFDDLPGDVELVGEGGLPDDADGGAFVEGVIEDVEDGTATVAVGNIGGTAVDERTVELRKDGEVVAEETVSLDPLEETVLQLEAAELPLVMDTGDVERSTAWDF